MNCHKCPEVADETNPSKEASLTGRTEWVGAVQLVLAALSLRTVRFSSPALRDLRSSDAWAPLVQLVDARRVCRRQETHGKFSDCPCSAFAALQLWACEIRVSRKRAALECGRLACGRRDLPISAGPCA